MLNCSELYYTKDVLKQMSNPEMTYPEFFKLIFKQNWIIRIWQKNGHC